MAAARITNPAFEQLTLKEHVPNLVSKLRRSTQGRDQNQRPFGLSLENLLISIRGLNLIFDRLIVPEAFVEDIESLPATHAVESLYP